MYKSQMYKLMLMYAMAGIFNSPHKSNSDFYLSEDERAELKKIKENKIIELKRKGLKEFNIDGHIVYAINEKNAIRKAKAIIKPTP